MRGTLYTDLVFILVLYNMLCAFLSCRVTVSSLLKGADGLLALIYPHSIKEHHVSL